MQNKAKLPSVLITMLLLSGLISTAEAAQSDDIRVYLGEPVDNATASGIGLVRGWAVAPAGIERVELYVDGDPGDGPPDQIVPYGSVRPDVCRAGAPGAGLPDCAGSRTGPGFASQYNFNELGADERHTFTVRVFDKNGDHNDDDARVSIASFGESFVGEDALSLPAFQLSNLTKNAGKPSDGRFDVELQWRPAAQQYVITGIGPGAAPGIAFLRPGTPVNLMTAKDGGNVELTWTDSTDRGDFDNEQWFIIERKFGRSPAAGQFQVIGVEDSGSTSFLDTDVSLSSVLPGTYTYRVIAYVTTGGSNPSNTDAVAQENSGPTPDPDPDVAPPDLPPIPDL